MKTLISTITAGYLVGFIIATPSPVVAEDNMSAVQLAAAAKLIGKLGKLRGSVKPGDHSIFLTMEMVAPVRKSRSFRGITGGIPKGRAKPEKSKLPPIVLEMGPDVDNLLEKIMSGKESQQAGSKPETVRPVRLQDALTLARAEKTPAQKRQMVAFRKRAVNYLEDYFTPPTNSR